MTIKQTIESLAASIDTILFDCDSEQWHWEIKHVAEYALAQLKWERDTVIDVAFDFTRIIVSVYHTTGDASDAIVGGALKRAMKNASL